MHPQKDKKEVKLLGQKIRETRIAKGLTQEELANNCDIEISQISRIERGVICTSVFNIFLIAKKLKVNVKDLFDFKKTKKDI